jgi:hypothetical protein
MSGWSKPEVLTEEEKRDVFAAGSEERRENAEKRAKAERLTKAVKDEKRKGRQNERKRHSRANKRAAAEAENPGGKKRRKVSRRKSLIARLAYRVQVVLKDGKTASRAEVAEASRPAHQIKKKIKDETRKPSGRKQKKPVRPAKYVNWLTPFSWSAITKAQRKVGWGYTDIIRELKRGNFEFYQHLAVTTVREWVEEVGGFKQWKPSVLARATKGNIPGHHEGGRGGVLVIGSIQLQTNIN